MSEELQRYLKDGRYEGDKLNSFEHYILGATTLAQLKTAGIIERFVTEISFRPRIWKGKPSPQSKPDELVLSGTQVMAVVERKSTRELRTLKQEEEAAEQCLVYMQQLNAKLGVVTDYTKFLWINGFDNTVNETRYIYDGERLFSGDYRKPAIIQRVLEELDSKTDSLYQPLPVDPSKLADSVWQTIWLATQEEPKLCLATFVELFLFKFLSDLKVLPEAMRTSELNIEPASFQNKYGITQIEYYCQRIRPEMKHLFPENSKFVPPIGNFKHGSDATSIIDGFAFLEPGISNHNHPLSTFNNAFLVIIKAFIDFGEVQHIDSEFKSRVYERFLKKNVKQQKLGQYLTPRNIVRAITSMANPQSLMRRTDTSICDPACGVGGFLLEPLLHDDLLRDNLIINDTSVQWRTEIVGTEVDRQTNILAKANMLIHLAEIYRNLSKRQRESFITLMNETFLLTDHTKMIGVLEFPQDNRFDLIMTNPPFVVRGSRVIKSQMAEIEQLEKRFAQSGLGIESLFVRWVVDALKPGGRAFVIIPTGILTRVETAVRKYLLEHCILDGIISLPERTFYNTPNPTYILCFTKKTTNIEKQHDNIFAYIVREIGETRDVLRLPCKTDLKDMVRQFRAFYADKDVFESRNLNCKLIPRNKLTPADRWDINIFWTDEEIAELGLTETSAITIDQFESEFNSLTEGIRNSLEGLRGEQETQVKYIEISLSDERYFELQRGKRITRRTIHKYPGDIPVISTSAAEMGYLGHISEEWLRENGHPIFDQPLITINSDGSVGSMFVRREPKYTINDVVIALRILDKNLDQLYLMYAIKEAIARSHFRYDAKLYMKRLKALNIRVPIDQQGHFNLEEQQQKAEKYEKLEELKDTIEHFTLELQNKFVSET